MQDQAVFFRRNDTLITVRRVSSADAAAMQRFVTGLGHQSRRWRFHGCVNACGDGFLRHLTDVDGVQHVAFVACVGDEIVGEARYFRDAHVHEAEFAIAVADAYQRGGVASLLMRTLLRAARAAGIAHLYGDVLEGNARMAAFMVRQGFAEDLNRWDQVESGIVRYQRAVRTPLAQRLRLPRLPRLSMLPLAKLTGPFARRDVAL